MGMRSKEFVGVAEGIRNRELTTKQAIEALKNNARELKALKQSLESKLAYLEAATAAAYENTDEDGNPDYALIASLEAEKSDAANALLKVENQEVKIEEALKQTERELEAVMEKKEQTLFEIQERARKTSQNISLAGGMYGAYAGVGSALQGSFRSSLAALSQAAGILGGSVPGASGKSASGAGNIPSHTASAANIRSVSSSDPISAFTVDSMRARGLPLASHYVTNQFDRSGASIPSFGDGTKSIHTKPTLNFSTGQHGNGYAPASFSQITQDAVVLPTRMQYSSEQTSRGNEMSFSTGTAQTAKSAGGVVGANLNISPEELAYLDSNTADTGILHMARDAEGNNVPARQAAYHSPFSNQQDTNGAFSPDGWKSTQLSQGDVLFQLGESGGTKSSYFTDYATVSACINPRTGCVDLAQLKEKLQIVDRQHRKDTLSAYVVTRAKGIYAAESYAEMNKAYGKGGGKQYFIPHANDIKGLSGGMKQINFEEAINQKRPVSGRKGLERQHAKMDETFRERIAVTPKEHSQIISSATQRELQEYVKRNNLATFAEFGSLNQKVSRDLVRAVYSAKKTFPFLQMSYIGSLQERNKFAEEKLRQHYTQAYQRANPSVPLDELRPYIEKRLRKDMEDFTYESDDIAVSYYFDQPESFADGARKLAIGIAVNETLVSNYEDTQVMCEQMVDRGISPKGCTTIKSVIDHEIAHQISEKIGAHNDPEIQSLFDKFRRQSKERCADLLSIYAQTDIHEFIAEAWAEYCNNPSPRRIALFVGTRLKTLGRKYSADDENIQERVL